MPEEFQAYAEITKLDDDEQVAYGWVTVYEENGQPVVDRQGHRISEAEVVKMAHKFASDSRVAKTMHSGDQVGGVVESIVLTRDLQKALGIDLGKAGWFIGMKVDSSAVWKRVKAGELRGFSIGGKGRHVPVVA